MSKKVEIPENRNRPLRDKRPCPTCGEEADVHLSVITKKWHWTNSGRTVKKEQK